ncbi:uncharacterized protein LOC130550032 [Triplophysa rosa]|uniref:uncharacterized protein LOC130550032 n=1 Tax=Triplophysa rosa TaxID=992332 RepID=UPI002545FD0E|nr:uncharacterized protein LOC130550032 [Triplophysa rosa]XP_057183353.1 uncharacterized protein LOC130550032 [Triplophysa rosa]
MSVRTTNVTTAQVHAEASSQNRERPPQTEQSRHDIATRTEVVVNDNDVWDDNLVEAWEAADFTQADPAVLPANQEAFRLESGTSHTLTLEEVVLRNDGATGYAEMCGHLAQISTELRLAREERQSDREERQRDREDRRRDRKLFENFKRIVTANISKNSVGIRESLARQRLIRSAVKDVLENQSQSVVLFMEIINMARRRSGE